MLAAYIAIGITTCSGLIILAGFLWHASRPQPPATDLDQVVREFARKRRAISIHNGAASK